MSCTPLPVYFPKKVVYSCAVIVLLYAPIKFTCMFLVPYEGDYEQGTENMPSF